MSRQLKPETFVGAFSQTFRSCALYGLYNGKQENAYEMKFFAEKKVDKNYTNRRYIHSAATGHRDKSTRLKKCRQHWFEFQFTLKIYNNSKQLFVSNLVFK